MRYIKVSLVVLLLLGLIGLVMTTALGNPLAGGSTGAAYEAPRARLLVNFADGTANGVKLKILAKHSARVVDEIKALNTKVIQMPERDAAAVKKAIRAEPAVDYVETDHIVRAVQDPPNDPSLGLQWAAPKIQATGNPGAWDVTTGTAAIKIAVLDTGVDQNHEDLAAKIVANRNFTSSKTVDDKYGHGTHVAGIAAAATNNGKGVAGVGYNTAVMNGKVLGDNGSGYTSWIANGITWAADNNASVINLSLGGPSPSLTMEAAVNYAWNKDRDGDGDGDVIVAAAAGNDGSTAPLYPAFYANAIAVAASDQNDNKAGFSNYGGWVDVAAPGVEIFSTLPNHRHRLRQAGLNYGYLNGTSMATPEVAGLAGLVWATGYGTSNSSVRNRIESLADTATTGNIYSAYGLRRINAYRAVAP